MRVRATGTLLGVPSFAFPLSGRLFLTRSRAPGLKAVAIPLCHPLPAFGRRRWGVGSRWGKGMSKGKEREEAREGER